MEAAGSETFRRSAFTAFVAIVGIVIYAAVKMYNTRKLFNDLRKQGLPVGEWNWMFGNWLELKKHMDKLPSDCDAKYPLTEMALATKKGGVYIDMWPFTAPLFIVTSPMLATQIREEVSEPIRSPEVTKGIESITGGKNLLTLPDGPWKQWRAIFNPGFSPNYMLEQTPKIVEHVEIFVEKMRDHAKANKMFQLEEDTLRLTLDIIGVIALDLRFDYQRRDSPIPKSLRAMIECTTFNLELNPFKRLNPIPSLLLAYHDRKLQKHIDVELQKCFAQRKASMASGEAGSRARSIISLALDAYTTENKRETETLDPAFKHQAATQLRLFMFAGHDTTSSTMIYAYDLLAHNPTCLARLRAEHDAVLGPDPSAAGSLLSASPVLINQLTYTTACIKETLRLFPPAGSTRVGNAGTTLTDEDGHRYPTANTTIHNLSFALHRNARFFTSPAAFLPDRWLVAAGHPLHPPARAAYRPFELGPRNCIGQTLALLELKVVLALTARRFDVVPAYAEWDALHPRAGVTTAFGHRAYGVSDSAGGSHAVSKYPCRVRVRE